LNIKLLYTTKVILISFGIACLCFTKITIMKTYAERKENARQIAISWQNENGCYPYSYEGWKIVSDYFRRLGKRYGLLTEFKENGIPC